MQFNGLWRIFAFYLPIEQSRQKDGNRFG